MDTTPPKPGAKWTGKRAYVLAVVCMILGIPVGYLLRGPSKGVVNTTVQQRPAMPDPASRPDQVSPEQLKRMADKQAEPLLAALQRDPNNPELLAQLGSVYLRAQQFPAATEYYQRAIKIKPTAEGYVSLSNAYHYAGADDRALEALNQALQIDPKSANALFNLGMLSWRVKNDPQAAIAAWQRLLKTNPQHPRRAEVESLIAKARQHVNMPAGTKTDKPAM